MPEQTSNRKMKTYLLLIFLPLVSLLIGVGLTYHLLKPAAPNQQATINQQPVKFDSPDDRTVMTAIEKAKANVVSVTNLQNDNMSFLLRRSSDDTTLNEVSEGSGIIYKIDNKEAYIITNSHVIAGANSINVTLDDGHIEAATLVGEDIWTDLAVLKINAQHVSSTMSFGNSDQIALGETVIAIGSPLGQSFAGSVSKGIISGLDRTVPVDINNDDVQDWEANVIQTDAAINPGNSGGALVNTKGQLVGINSMKISVEGVEGIGFAIPSNEVEKIAQQLITEGKVSRPTLGVQLESLSNVPSQTLTRVLRLPQEINKGVIIVDVEDNSLAHKLGLKQGDVITKINDYDITNAVDLRKVLFLNIKNGDNITITYYREGTLHTAKGQLKY